MRVILLFADIIKEKGLAQVNDEEEIKKIVNEVLEANQKSIEDYKNGTYLMSAECYGDGINMWLGAQGDKVKIIEEVKL